MNAKQAFNRLIKIRKELTALYAEERKIETAVGRNICPYKYGDILSVRDPETNRISYWKVVETTAMLDTKNKTMRPIVQARRCTRSGQHRGWNKRLSDETLARAEIVRTANVRDHSPSRTAGASGATAADVTDAARSAGEG